MNQAHSQQNARAHDYKNRSKTPLVRRRKSGFGAVGCEGDIAWWGGNV